MRVHRRGKDEKISIRVREEDSSVSVAITCSNTSFANVHDDSLCILEMTERARQFGGVVEFKDGIHEGTLVLLIPPECCAAKTT